MEEHEQQLLKIPFFRLGQWRHPIYGLLNIDRAFFDQMVQNYRQNVLGRPVFVRIGHDRASSPVFGGAAALAWVEDIAEEDGVLYAIARPTGNSAVALIKTGQYRYASAEYIPNYRDKETGEDRGPVLSAIALTNEPFLTRLPPATVALSQSPEFIFYLDYAEVLTMSQIPDDVSRALQEQTSLIKKLTDYLAGFVRPQPQQDDQIRKQQPIAEPPPVVMNKLAGLEEELARTRAALAESQAREKVRAVEQRLEKLVALGIPPVMCDKARELLLALPDSEQQVKLADGNTRPVAELIYGLLESLPAENRLKLSQQGFVDVTKPGTAAAIYGDIVPGLK